MLVEGLNLLKELNMVRNSVFCFSDILKEVNVSLN